jgi:hypothetical protein
VSSRRCSPVVEGSLTPSAPTQNALRWSSGAFVTLQHGRAFLLGCGSTESICRSPSRPSSPSSAYRFVGADEHPRWLASLPSWMSPLPVWACASHGCVSSSSPARVLLLPLLFGPADLLLLSAAERSRCPAGLDVARVGASTLDNWISTLLSRPKASPSFSCSTADPRLFLSFPLQPSLRNSAS